MESSLEELSRELPKPILDHIINATKEFVESKKFLQKRLIASLRSDRSFYNIQVGKDGEWCVTSLKIKHGTSFYDSEFGEESDGTKRLFDLIDMLLNDSDETVYIIDELERSLHPKLTEHFIELFSKTHSNDRGQLIFTTLMDRDLFRRDEIWFLERDASNKSCLYSLDSFKERYDKKLSKAYLEGRYGAIPVFSDFAFWRE